MHKRCPNCQTNVPGAKVVCDCGFVFFKRLNGIVVHAISGNGRRQCPDCGGWIHRRHEACACGHAFGDTYNGSDREFVRLAIEPAIIEQAKRASGQKTFADTIEHAAKMFLPTIARNLYAAGFQPIADAEYSVYPVSIATIKAIDRASERRGISRSALIRALFNLEARELLTSAEISEENAQFEKALTICLEPDLRSQRKRREPKPKPKKRKIKRYTCNGETLTASEWAERLGRSRERIRQRLEKYPIEVALFAAPSPPLPRPGRRHMRNMPNKLPGKRYVHNGESLTIKEWAERLGLSTDVLRHRLKHNPHEMVLSGNWDRKRKMYTFDGQTMTLPQWAKKMGVSVTTAYSRLTRERNDSVNV